MSKDLSQIRQKEMIAKHFDRLAAAPDTGEKTAYTFVPGNLNELVRSFDLLPVLPEINALQSGLRKKSGQYIAEAEKHGFKRALVPRANVPRRALRIDVVPVDRLSDALAFAHAG